MLIWDWISKSNMFLRNQKYTNCISHTEEKKTVDPSIDKKREMVKREEEDDLQEKNGVAVERDVNVFVLRNFIVLEEIV